MDDLVYRDILLDHWRNPKNYGTLQNPTNEIDADNPLCGDSLHLSLVINNNVLTNIKFISEGCAISKAAASILTEYVKGKEIKKIKKISQGDFLSYLEIEITVARFKCALLGYSALQKALKR